MSKQAATKRVAELVEQLTSAAYAYYTDGTSPISDAEYDAAYRELQSLETVHPDLQRPDSPTLRVGAPLPRGSSFDKADHLLPMLSLDSLTTNEEVEAFDERARSYLELEEDAPPLQWTVEPKFDGVSANLLFENGVFTRGLSRGDGTTGEDVTQNLRTIRNLPLALRGDGPKPTRIEVRGEVILSRESFRQLQEESETTTDTPFRNARNTVAGTLKLLDPSVVASRRLEFICFGVGRVEGLDVGSYSELYETLQSFGFTMSQWFEIVDGIDGVIEFHDRLELQRDSIPYELDGIVAKVDDLELQRRLGRTARTPRWALAHKFAPQRGTTRVISITSQVGRTGVVTPVAELEPIELTGVTVRRATLHNWGLLAERDVRAGDEVDVERAGDVIPAVVQVHADRRQADSVPTAAPTACPTCGSELQPEGAFLYCVNLECPDTLRGRLVHLSSRRALEIERLGPKAIDQLMEAGLLRNLEDVFALPDKRDAILELDRWGEKSVDKLEAEIEAAKQPALDRFIHAMGIRHVGEQTAKDLAAELGSLEALASADAEALCEVNGVGPEVAESVVQFFAREGNQRFLSAIRDAGVAVKAVEGSSDGPLVDRVFCFTGGLNSMSRDEAKILVEQHGAKTAASITKKVTDVVAGAKAGSKLEKAKKLEIDVLTEDEFVALIESLAGAEGS